MINVVFSPFQDVDSKEHNSHLPYTSSRMNKLFLVCGMIKVKKWQMTRDQPWFNESNRVMRYLALVAV